MQSVTLVLGFLATILASEYVTAEAKTDISGSDSERHLENIIRRIVKRQTRFELSPRGDGAQLTVTNTRGGTRWGGNVYHGNSIGTGAGAFGSHTWSSGGGRNSFGGSISRNFGSGRTSGGLTGSRTWSHGGGRSTSIGGYVNHNFGGGTSGGFRISHRFK